MRILWTIKNIFRNYKYLIIIIAMEFVLQFTQIKRHGISDIINEILGAITNSLNFLDFLHNSSFLIKELTYLIFLVCICSGVLFIAKKIINQEPYSLGHFAIGIESNWKKVLTAGLLFTCTIGLIILVAQYFVFYLRFSDDVIYLYMMESVVASLSLFYTSLIIYGSITLIENGFNIRNLFSEIVKFIFSKEGLKLYIIMLLLSLLTQPIVMIRVNYIQDLINSNAGVFGMLDMITLNPPIPLWLKCLEWLSNAIITSFIVLYTSLIFYWNSSKSEFFNHLKK